MSSRISYMGTKHELADHVAAVISNCRPGTLLDAFAGMGAVAEAHAGKRQVWTNDVQYFAYLAGRCRFTDPRGPMPATVMCELATPIFNQNLTCLRDLNSQAWTATQKIPRASTFEEFDELFRDVTEQAISHDGAYGCFTSTYANSYFSLIQCAEIDSIRCALDTLLGRGALSKAQFDWGLLALGHAALRVANTTGHFAQFLTPSSSNFVRVAKQFGRPIFRQWIASLSSIPPSGTPEWRNLNTASRSDCDSLVRSVLPSDNIGVVYCDPPYTDDQYSRFYHVWETLVLYDYPVVTGRGLYRPGRFTTNFSLRTKVASAFESLVEGVASTGADLVLSYPSNGLLHDVGQNPLAVLKRAYPNVELAIEIQHSHSTMGASKGNATAKVAERIYVARA